MLGLKLRLILSNGRFRGRLFSFRVNAGFCRVIRVIGLGFGLFSKCKIGCWRIFICRFCLSVCDMGAGPLA